MPAPFAPSSVIAAPSPWRRLGPALLLLAGAELGCAGSTKPPDSAPPQAKASATPTEVVGDVSAKTSTVARDPLPPPSRDRFEVSSTPVEFPGDGGFQLVGELDFPKGALSKGSILLVHDSGAHDRRGTMSGQLGLEFGFEVPVLELLAKQLSARGYTVMRYDKRTCGKFNDCADNAYPAPKEDVDLTTVLRDAAFAVDALADHLMTDPTRLIVMGLGQGGTLVPHLLQSRGGLAGGVLLGAPHAPVDELYLEQAKQIAAVLRAKRVPSSATNPLKDLAMRVSSLRAEAVQDIVAGHPAAYWRAWLNLSDSAPAIARQITRPILVVGGSLDWSVPQSQRAAWAQTLAASARARVITIPNMTHALNRVSSKSIASIQSSDVARGIDPDLIDVLDSFLVYALKGR